MKRGWNLRAGAPDGDQGRSTAGRKHAAHNTEILDDSGRTLAQYWGQLGFLKKVRELGSESAARAYMAGLGVKSFAKRRREYSRYLYECRQRIAEND